MSDAAFADIHADRRQHVRRRVQQEAALVLRDVHYQCNILDQSDGGVLVQAEQALALPEEAVIKFSDSASQLVRRCWASANRAGYQFVQLVPVQRHWRHDHPPEAPVDVLALNNFVAASQALLNLYATSPDRLHSIAQICVALLEMPRIKMPEADAAATGGRQAERLTVPQAAAGSVMVQAARAFTPA